jgi:signal transduction histidine kinase
MEPLVKLERFTRTKMATVPSEDGFERMLQALRNLIGNAVKFLLTEAESALRRPWSRIRGFGV